MMVAWAHRELLRISNDIGVLCGVSGHEGSQFWLCDALVLFKWLLNDCLIPVEILAHLLDPVNVLICVLLDNEWHTLS